METITISKFKATCLALLERVRRTGQPVLITRRGEPVAQVIPPPLPRQEDATSFGCMAGTAEEVGDILDPLPETDWEVLR